MVIFDGHWRALCAYARHLYPDDCPTGGFDDWSQYVVSVNGRSLQKGGANEVVVEAGKPVRVRVLDAGTMAFFKVHLGGLTGEVIAKDGRRVKCKAGPCGKHGKKTKEFPIAGANRVDVLLQIPEKGGCFPIVAKRVNVGDGVEALKTEQGALILKTKDAGPCQLPPAYTKQGTMKQINMQDWMDMTGSLEAENSIIDPQRKPDVEHLVDLTGGYDFITGENRPGFTVNGKELHLWPTRVWCHVPDDCEGAKSTVEDTVIKEKFCQGAQVSSNVKCDEFKCAEGTSGRDAFGRCLPWINGKRVTDDIWGDSKVHTDNCAEWKIRPAEFSYNPLALEVCHGDRVWLTYANHDTGKSDGHPIHLHGTHQQLVKVNGKMHIGPQQDTWFLVKGHNITVAFDALNPGEWLLHCHIEHHLVNGMGTTLRYVINDRCRKRMDLQGKANFQHTPETPVSEWPDDWDSLWKRIEPVKSFFPEPSLTKPGA